MVGKATKSHHPQIPICCSGSCVASIRQQHPYGRNIAGVPPKNSADYAWVQHMIKSMAPTTGRMAVVVPHGVLFRMGAEGEIRRKLLEMDLLEAVIGLGPNLFYGTGLAACILVFRARKQPDREGRVLFVDASTLFKRGRNQNTLEPEHVAQIYSLYHNYRDVEGLARIVTLDDIEATGYNLNIPRYVEPPTQGESTTVQSAIASLEYALTQAYTAEDRLAKLLEEAGLL